MRRRTFLLGGVGSAAAVAAVGGALVAGGEPAVDPEEKDFACTGAGSAEVVWSFPTDRREVALTFDDGPHPVLTPLVADLLAERGVRATFFLIGAEAERHPRLVQRLRHEGHELANHTWSHRPMAHVSGKEAREEVLRGSEAIERVAGVTPTWFRSPRGMLNGAVLRAAADCGQHVAMWTAKPTPAMSASPAAAADSLLRDLAPGSIYLFHDGTSGRESPLLEERRRAELPLIEAVLDRLDDRGYALRTLSELSAARAQVA